MVVVPETSFKVQIRQGKVKRILTFTSRRKWSPENQEDVLLAFEEWALKQLK